MMIQRQLDVNGDWTFGKGRQNFVTGVNAMMLNIQTRLKEWRGDCFWNENAGVDWHNFLDVGTEKLLNRDIINVILNSSGVITIDSYSTTLTDRALSVTAKLKTIYGSVTLSEQLGLQIGSV